MEIFSQVLVNGILFGVMYGIAAIGLSVIFGTMRIVFLAQGSVIIFFAYLCYWGFTLLGIDPYLSMIPMVIIALALGAAFYYGLFKETAILQDRISSLLIAVGLTFIIDNFMQVVWTTNPRSVVTSYAFANLTVFGVRITVVRLIALAIGIIAMVCVYLFLKNTLMGKAVRATSEDAEIGMLMGISPNQVNTIAFAIGIALAVISGTSFATTYSFDSTSGLNLAIKALIALTLGGIGNVGGALLGGIIIGVIESMASFYVNMGWSQGILFAIFILALMFRPSGLFGKINQKV